MNKDNNKKFYISLEGIEFEKEQIKRIEKGIHELVLREISKTNTIPDNSILLTKFPNLKETTMGMWMPHKDSIIRI